MRLFCGECKRRLQLDDGDERICPFCGSDLPAAAPVSNEAPAAATYPPIGRYRVIRPIGKGGLADVVEAHDDDLGRAVAIKVLHASLLQSASAVELFLQEARTLAGLDHPGIIPIHDVGRTPEGRGYLVMKLFRGSDLRQRLREGSVPRLEAAGHVAAAAEALHHAHQHGLVHRDVKPANLLLDHERRLVVADFGLALREENFGTGPQFVGTVPYMSPEQARREGHRVDARTDVYSLGVVLYELLTGQRPFTGADDAEILERIRTAEAVAPRRLDVTVPRELDRICAKAIAKRASDRYPTARDLADDLRAWLTVAKGEPETVAQGNGLPALAGQGSQMVGPGLVPRGLRAFTEEDAEFFLRLLPGPRNRDGLPETVGFWKTRLESTDAEVAFRVGVLGGPSGSGKSSLVKAGILPRLADHVTIVRLESCPEGTEPRLRRALYRLFPTLPPDLDLPGAMEALRRSLADEPGRKVVIVVDQFEQWLHGMGTQKPEVLTDAFRQCDGARLQCLLLVRDDFWLPLSGFLRNVEVRLQEGVNTAFMDLFDPLHAQHVLADFGRAYGRLPVEGPLPAPGAKFVDQAVAELAVAGKVAPVRLSLFAEMMKGRPWTPESLAKMGGAERIGEAFLEETFGDGAPAAHRIHAAAAAAILKALLPPPGMPIKGYMRVLDELRQSSGYETQPERFNEVIQMLDRELRLVSPAFREQEGPRTAPGRGAPKAAAEPAYQLTHDYLIGSVSTWLSRRLRETRRGRAALRLAQCTEWWVANPEDRHLPTLGEWAGIRAFTSRSDWTDPQQRMMRRADRYYLGRATAVVLGIGVLVGIAGYFYREQAERHNRKQAAALVRRLQASDWSQVANDVREFEPWVVPHLRQLIDAGEGTPTQQLYLRMALVAVDHQQVAPLREALLRVGFAEQRQILLALEPHRAEVVAELWTVTENKSASPEERFHAAAALAQVDAGNPRWSRMSAFVARELAENNGIALSEWTPAFRSVREVLIPPLLRVFHDAPKGRVRARATGLLADYASDRPAVLAELDPG